VENADQGSLAGVVMNSWKDQPQQKKARRPLGQEKRRLENGSSQIDPAEWRGNSIDRRAQRRVLKLKLRKNKYYLRIGFALLNAPKQYPALRKTTNLHPPIFLNDR
jgi:hypothetical protein